MNIELRPIENQHGYLHIHFDHQDYHPQVKERLSKIRKTSHIKGFRQGTAPVEMIQKLYGEQIKAEILDKMLNQSIEDYQKNNHVVFIGDLLPAKTESQDVLEKDNLEFVFEVGIAPQVELDGVLEELKLTKYIVQIPEERIDEEVQHMQKKLGNAVEVEDAVQLNDIVALDIFELDGDIRKEGGWTSNCVVLMEDMVTDEFKEIVLEKKVGDTIRFNVFKIEKDLSYEHVRKYFLNIEANNEEIHTGEWFEGMITKVSRRTQAEMNEEFFKKAFGQATEITNEAEARVSIRSNIESYFGQETDKLLDIELVQNVVKKVNLYFPDTFLIKWLQASYEEWKKKSDHDLKHDLMHFKEGLSWKLIREAISSKANLKVEYPEIEQHAIQQMKAQYPGIQLPEESWKEFANRSLSNKDKAYEQFVEVLNNKVLAWLKEKVDIQDLEINLENFREKVKEINSHDHH